MSVLDAGVTDRTAVSAAGRCGVPAGELIGGTALVALDGISSRLPHRLVGKCEFLNPHGSVKDRIGRHIIARAEQAGLIVPGRHTLIEATAGNTGVALAAAAAGRYRLVCTMSSKMGAEKEALLRAWGAEVVRCPYEVEPASPLSFLNTARRLAGEIQDAYYVNQFENPWNVEAHYLTTGPELVAQLGGIPDVVAVVAGAGTGATFTGVGRRLREAGLPCRRVLADPVGSVLGDAAAGRPQSMLAGRPYRIEGIGGDFVPKLLDLSLVTDVVSVPDAESVAACLELAGTDGLLLGGSSGCAVAAAMRLAERLPGPRSTIVVVLPDRGERYLSTIYNAEWRVRAGLA